MKKSPVAVAVANVARPQRGSLEMPKDNVRRQSWEDLEAISMEIRTEIQDMAISLNEAVELVRAAPGMVNAREFDIAVSKTNKDLETFTSDFLVIANTHRDRRGAVQSDDDLAECLAIYEKYMQFKALFNGVFHHTAILFTEFSLQAKDGMEAAMIEEAKKKAEANKATQQSA